MASGTEKATRNGPHYRRGPSTAKILERPTIGGSLTVDAKKYELTEETMSHLGYVVLHRIRALVDIPEIGVRAGDLGGWIEKEENLSHEGSCWIFDEAKAYGRAHILEEALLRNKAEVLSHATVSGDAVVEHSAVVSGNAWVSGEAVVSDDALVFRNAWIYGKAKVCGNAFVFGEACVYGCSVVDGVAYIYGDSRIGGNVHLQGHTVNGGYTRLA